MKPKLLRKIILLRKLNETRQRRNRTLYIRQIFFNRSLQGDMALVQELRFDPLYHHKYFRMDKSSFDELYDLVRTKLLHKNTHARPIDPMTRLCMTLRYLATGHSQVSIAMSYRVSPSSVRLILQETMKILSDALQIYLNPPTKNDLKNMAKEFFEKWNFPFCVGAIDGKHIRIQCPSRSGSEFFNYKEYFSIVLLAVVDANYKFSLVDIGRSGSNSDSGILARSTIGKAMESPDFLPEPGNFCDTGLMMPYFWLGDSGFPLKNNLIRPYPIEIKGEAERTFNYRLSRARMVSENAFGILASRWRIFHTSIIANHEFVKLIVLCSVTLHNFLRAKGDKLIYPDVVTEGEIVPGNWRAETPGNLNPIGRQGSPNYNIEASNLRDILRDYFMSDGSLKWQKEHVQRGFQKQ